MKFCSLFFYALPMPTPHPPLLRGGLVIVVISPSYQGGVSGGNLGGLKPPPPLLSKEGINKKATPGRSFYVLIGIPVIGAPGPERPAPCSAGPVLLPGVC